MSSSSLLEGLQPLEATQLNMGAKVITQRGSWLLGPNGERLCQEVRAGTWFQIVVGTATTYQAQGAIHSRPGVVVFCQDEKIMGILPIDICQVFKD